MENKNEKYKEAIKKCDQLIENSRKYLEHHRKRLLCYERKKRRIEKLMDQNQGTRLNGAAKKKGIDVDALLEAIERGELDGFKLKPNEEDIADAADVSNTENADDTADSEETINSEDNEKTEEKEYGKSKHNKDSGSAG
ncbi:MAG: hypothetical protein IK093_17090 [Ruminiclostridium sp.]|nr:hypothetical protein [Ruminiclostridium sp.]